MRDDLFNSGKKMDFTNYTTYEEIDPILRRIFTNNPNFWSDRPLYLDSTGQLNNVVKGIINGHVNVYEHTFPLVEPEENKHEDIVIYNYCFGISKVRSNLLLPLVYYNAFLHMDKIGFSLHRIDNVSKIMHVRKNKYNSIFDVIKWRGQRFDLDDFLRDSDNFVDLDEFIRCECGSVEAYRVEAGIFYGVDGYIIFPFPTDNEAVGRMYYFEKA